MAEDTIVLVNPDEITDGKVRAMFDKSVLTEEVRSFSVREGAALIGFASMDRFDGSPRGHHPAEIVSGAHAVITFGVPLVEQVVDWEELFLDSEVLGPDIRRPILQEYLYSEVNYNFINDLLNHIALRLTLFLQAQGFRSTMFPATFGPAQRHFHDMMPGLMALFSNRHAAVRAGLGEFGLNNVVVTPQYGPRIRFNSVITQAPLVASPILKEKVCLGTGCGLCIERCGGKALSLIPTFADDEVWLNPVSRTDKLVCREVRTEAFCYGRCLQVCPVGRHTQPAAPSVNRKSSSPAKELGA
jgi:epoxyqueuosine reductase